jgi:hypothetical protein
VDELDGIIVIRASANFPKNGRKRVRGRRKRDRQRCEMKRKKHFF